MSIFFIPMILCGQHKKLNQQINQNADSCKISIVRYVDKKTIPLRINLNQEENWKWINDLKDTVITLSSYSLNRTNSKNIIKIFNNSNQDSGLLGDYDIVIDFYYLNLTIQSAKISSKNRRFVIEKYNDDKIIDSKKIFTKGKLNNKSLQYILKSVKYKK